MPRLEKVSDTTADPAIRGPILAGIVPSAEGDGAPAVSGAGHSAPGRGRKAMAKPAASSYAILESIRGVLAAMVGILTPILG
ncbi:hypothetical protein [Arthrobacter sp. HLT1-20]